MTTMSTSPTARTDAIATRGLIIGVAIIAPLLAWLFWEFFAAQVKHATTRQADWGHTLVMPLIAGYFVYLNRERLLSLPFRTAWAGLVPVVIGSLWYMVCWLGPQTLRHHNLQGAGLALTLFGIVLLFFGFRAMTILWFPLLYMCVFGQTISDKFMNPLTQPMQDITARGSYYFMTFLTPIDVERSGNVLKIWKDGEVIPLNIAEACSGMRMLMAFLALGVAMAYTGFKHNWQRITLVLLGVPVAIFVNLLRVVTLAVLSLADTDFAAGQFHTFIGLVWLVPAFLLYLGIMWILRNLIVDESGGDKMKSKKTLSSA